MIEMVGLLASESSSSRTLPARKQWGPDTTSRESSSVTVAGAAPASHRLPSSGRQPAVAQHHFESVVKELAGDCIAR